MSDLQDAQETPMPRPPQAYTVRLATDIDGEPIEARMCWECSSLVIDYEQHMQWHARIVTTSETFAAALTPGDTK